MNKSILYFLALLTLAACHKKTEELDAIPAYGDWRDKIETSQDGSVVYTESRRDVSKEELQKVYSTTDLQSIPVDTSHNAQIFSIKNVPEYEDALFIAPKIYAYGSEDGVKLVPRQDGDKLILPFPVILVDGVQPLIQDARAGKEIQVPGQFLVKDLETLRKDLLNRYQKSVLASLPGCPRKILVRVPGKTFDVTPDLMKVSDYCQINTPFNVEIVVDKYEAEYLLRKAIAEGNVEIAAIYETKVSFAVARMSLNYEKSRVFSELQMALSGGNGYLKADIQVKITEILKKLNMRISIKGEYTEQMQILADQVFAMFFEPMPEVEKLKVPKCKDAAVCFSLAIQKDRYQEELKIEWEQSTNIMTGESIAISSKLRPTQDSVIRIGDPAANGGKDVRLALSNRGAPVETGFTIVSGDEFEIEPHFIQIQDQAGQSEIHQRQDNNLCVAMAPQPARSVDRENCAKWENRWTESVTFGLPGKDSFTRYDNPLGQLPKVFDGLYLAFVFREDGARKEVRCPIQVFNQYGDGRSIKMVLENRPGCEIFKPDRKVVSLSFGNAIVMTTEYKEGVETLDYKGSRTSNIQKKSFEPEIRFGGVIKFWGLGLASEK